MPRCQVLNDPAPGPTNKGEEVKEIISMAISVIRTTVAAAIDWVTDNLANLWDLHTEALRTRSSYRAEVVALVIGVVGLLSIQAPLDIVIAAAISAYVAYYGSHNGGPDFDIDPFM